MEAFLRSLKKSKISFILTQVFRKSSVISNIDQSLLTMDYNVPPPTVLNISIWEPCYKQFRVRGKGPRFWIARLRCISHMCSFNPCSWCVGIYFKKNIVLLSWMLLMPFWNFILFFDITLAVELAHGITTFLHKSFR